jgi:hypothetical protein
MGRKKILVDSLQLFPLFQQTPVCGTDIRLLATIK